MTDIISLHGRIALSRHQRDAAMPSGAVGKTSPRSPAAATIMRFERPQKGSYLQAAREQGICNTQEEFLELSSRAERRRRLIEMRDRADQSLLTPQGDAASRERELLIIRFRAIMDAYEAAGFGAPLFGLLKMVLFTFDLHHAEAEALFRAARISLNP